jgi:hypothetical protein
MDEDGFENVVAGDEDRFKHGRNGDNLITPFQCDQCHFINMKKRRPSIQNQKDRYLMKLVRRANLDACWAREPSTVLANLGQARKMEKIGEEIGLDSVAPMMGPFPVSDTFGMKIACTILHRTLDPGKHEAHIQFATARKIRSAYSNVYHASRLMKEVTVMAFETNKMYETSCPTYGYWFERFILGCHKRMGDIVVSDYALSKEIYLELMTQLEEDWQDGYTDAERDKIALFANLLDFGYLCGLRGEEIMKADISGFLKYLDIGAQDLKTPHVIVPLIGRLKGETGERYHMMVMARVTLSGVMAGRWADRLGRCLVRKRRRNGFLFVDTKGNQAKIGIHDDEFTERLTRIKMLKPHLFEPGLNIVEAYSLRRSLRRGSTSEATNRGVPRELIEMNNRWRKFENAKGRRPGMSMMAHYTEIRLMIASLWKYSRLF